jgi:Tfp pilus assembly protein PilO
MTSRAAGGRLVVAGGVVAALIISALSWFVVISPLRSDAETLRANTASVLTQNQAIATRTVTLRHQAENRDQLVESARQALAGLPSDAQLPDFSRQLTRQARAEGLELTSISVGASATAAPSRTGTSSGTLSIPVTVQTSGTMAQQLLFLHDLQRVGPRHALVSSTSLTPAQVGSTVETSSTMTVQLTVFAAPLSAAVREQLAGVLDDGSS